MNLTPSQKVTLKAAILADVSANAFYTNGDLSGLADYYNQSVIPVFWVWRSFVPDREIYEATSPDATVWSWTAFIARSQAERDAWRQMVNMAGGLSPSLANVRAGIADIFSGGVGAGQRAHLLALGRRQATKFEKVFATGTGSAASPATMVLEGSLEYEDLIGL